MTDARTVTFERYAEYYDALYVDKDYAGEAEYVVEVTRRAGRLLPARFSVLDLGCGTGRHIEALRNLGAGPCVGVDQSTDMLARASARGLKRGHDRHAPIFLAGDVASTRIASPGFDLVVSLFHVFSYQTTMDRAHAFMRTVASHLSPDGCAVFDFWFGPAVEADPPSRRSRLIKGVDAVFRRTATPRATDEEHVVNIEYEIVREDGLGGDPLVEVHAMRYWFLDEVRALAESEGLRVVSEYESGTWNAPSPSDWNCTVCCVPSLTSR